MIWTTGICVGRTSSVTYLSQLNAMTAVLHWSLDSHHPGRQQQPVADAKVGSAKHVFLHGLPWKLWIIHDASWRCSPLWA